MSTSQFLTLVLSSAAIGAVISSIVNGLSNIYIHQLQLKEDRMKLAVELAKMKDAQVLEAVKMRGGTATPWDPAVAVSDYLEALDEIARTGRWAAGDKNFDPLRKKSRE